MTRPTSPDTSMRFITRMPDRLWRVAVAFGTFKPAAVYFSDRHYGGEQAARAAAIAHRDHLVKKHKIPLRTYDGNGWQVARVTSPTNQVGLCLEVRDVHGTMVANWTYLFQKDGRQRRIRLSIRQHGRWGAGGAPPLESGEGRLAGVSRRGTAEATAQRLERSASPWATDRRDHPFHRLGQRRNGRAHDPPPAAAVGRSHRPQPVHRSSGVSCSGRAPSLGPARLMRQARRRRPRDRESQQRENHHPTLTG